MSNAEEIVRLINVLRADEGDSVNILCDNPDFNGQPNCAIECCGDWTGWLHKRFAADTLLDALSMAVTERRLPSPREVIATSNGHHWVKRFNLVCCRDCGFIRRADDQNSPCKGPAGVGIRQDLLPDRLTAHGNGEPHDRGNAMTTSIKIVNDGHFPIVVNVVEVERYRDEGRNVQRFDLNPGEETPSITIYNWRRYVNVLESAVAD